VRVVALALSFARALHPLPDRRGILSMTVRSQVRQRHRRESDDVRRDRRNRIRTSQSGAWRSAGGAR